jgi:hypothetical protein
MAHSGRIAVAKQALRLLQTFPVNIQLTLAMRHPDARHVNNKVF